MPRTRVLTSTLATEIDRLAESLMSQIPCGRLIFINPGSPNEKIAGECTTARSAPWFSVLAHRLGVIYHADNLWVYQTSQYLMEEATHQVEYVQIPGLIPFVTIPEGREMEEAAIKVALESLVRAVEDDGFEAAIKLADLPMVVVTQLHGKPDTPPTLPLALADALNLDEPFVRMIEEARLGPCHAIELTVNRAILHVV